jgi:hypothetical protein
MAYIGKQPVVGNFVKLDAITTSATATYNLTNGGVAYFPQTANNCIVSLNGVIQSPTSAYTISGSTIVFSDALTASDSIDFILVLGDVLSIGTPSDATVTNAKLALTAGSAGTPTISTATDTNTGIFFPAADEIALTEGGVEGVRLNSSGNVQFAGNLGIGGTTPSTSGKGISFPATQSGSSNANTLDDYEEGTFTAEFSSSGATFTYSVRQGTYTKVGRVVLFNIYIQLDGTPFTTTGNDVTITGLPFTSTTSSGSISAIVCEIRYVNLTAGANALTGRIGTNSVIVELLEQGDNYANTTLKSNQLSNSSGQVFLSGQYQTAT